MVCDCGIYLIIFAHTWADLERVEGKRVRISPWKITSGYTRSNWSQRVHCFSREVRATLTLMAKKRPPGQMFWPCLPLEAKRNYHHRKLQKFAIENRAVIIVMTVRNGRGCISFVLYAHLVFPVHTIVVWNVPFPSHNHLLICNYIHANNLIVSLIITTFFFCILCSGSY